MRSRSTASAVYSESRYDVACRRALAIAVCALPAGLSSEATTVTTSTPRITLRDKPVLILTEGTGSPSLMNGRFARAARAGKLDADEAEDRGEAVGEVDEAVQQPVDQEEQLPQPEKGECGGGEDDVRVLRQSEDREIESRAKRMSVPLWSPSPAASGSWPVCPTWSLNGTHVKRNGGVPEPLTGDPPRQCGPEVAAA